MDDLIILGLIIFGLYYFARALVGSSGSADDHFSDGKKHYGPPEECDLDGIPFARKGSNGVRSRGYYGPRR